MADEQEHEDETPGAPAAGSAPPEAAPDPTVAPAEALVRGLGLLFQAAVGGAEAMRTGVEKVGVPKTFEQVGRQIETVATTALRGLEQVVRELGRAATAGAADKPTSADKAEAASAAPMATAAEPAGVEPAAVATEPTSADAAERPPSEPAGAGHPGTEGGDGGQR
jgi:hypothetical protein